MFVDRMLNTPVSSVLQLCPCLRGIKSLPSAFALRVKSLALVYRLESLTPLLKDETIFNNRH